MTGKVRSQGSNSYIKEVLMPELSVETANIPLFEGISDDELNRILKAALVDEFPSGRVLFNEGSIVGHVMYVIISGEVEILRRNPGGNDVILATLKQGEFFGEMSLFDNQKRSATARVKSPARLLMLTKTTFDKLISSDPTVVNRLLLIFIRTLSERLRRTNEQVAALHK